MGLGFLIAFVFGLAGVVIPNTVSQGVIITFNYIFGFVTGGVGFILGSAEIYKQSRSPRTIGKAVLSCLIGFVSVALGATFGILIGIPYR